ncbi:MAG: histidine kinase [Gemmatimonadaceae bacterium]
MRTSVSLVTTPLRHHVAGRHASFVDIESTPNSIGRRQLLQIFAFWTIIALLSGANAAMEPRGRGLQPLLPAAPFALAFVQCYLWAIVTPIVFWMCGRYTVERANWVSRVAIYVIVAVIVSNLISMAIDFTRFEVLYAPRTPQPGRVFRPPNVLDGIRRLWWLDDLVVFSTVLTAGFARDYYLRYQQRREEARLLQMHAAQLQAQLVEARLSALRSQLNPHFLFNTLNAVSALVERDPRGVRRMIARLSELLRYSLDGGHESEVPLSRELGFLDRYLEIMQIRFQGKLQVTKEFGDDVGDALVPNLVLQTLVENALKYGVNQQDGTGCIRISAQRDVDRLILSVRDHGPGLRDGDAQSSLTGETGVGLKNTRARLEQLYGDAGMLTLNNVQDGGGVLAQVMLPFHTQMDLRTTGEMLRP